MHCMSDASVGMSWQLPDYSMFGLFVCLTVSNNVFSTMNLFLISLLLATRILRYALSLDILIDICFVLLCI